jgi:DNA-binding beta-propeller fold protein YncE
MRFHLAIVLVAACGSSSTPPASNAKPTPPVATPATPPPTGKTTSIALPGAPEGGVFLDYLAYDAAHHTVWVPAGGTGRVDVIDTKTGALTPIEGWKTQEMERRGQKRLVGPTSATVGDGVVYVGNRGDSSICAIDGATLARRDCVTLDSMPDGLQYVAATKEVWVTTPRDQSIRILDVSTPGHPVAKSSIKFDGEPEGFAVDNARGVFFTNLEDKDKTLVVDLKTHAITKTWQPKCGEDGPKGLVFDAPANHLVVVCPSSIETLDVAHDGAMISNLPIGDGLDAIDYTPNNRLVFAAAARAEKMMVATLAADGSLTQVATVMTAKGARNAVATEDGTAYVADGPAGAILVVPLAKPQ